MVVNVILLSSRTDIKSQCIYDIFFSIETINFKNVSLIKFKWCLLILIFVCVLAGVKNVCYILNYAFLIIAQLASIRTVTLANVICRNTDMNEIQRKALYGFFVLNVECFSYQVIVVYLHALIPTNSIYKANT